MSDDRQAAPDHGARPGPGGREKGACASPGVGEAGAEAEVRRCRARDFALRLAGEAEELKAEAVRVLDAGGLTDVFDFMVLATGGSARQLAALLRAVMDLLEGEGQRPIGVEGTEESGWVLVDIGEVVVHLFSRELRRYYDLDGLWADAETVYGADGA